MTTNPDPSERPEGLETRESIQPLPAEADRPDWLVGADSVLESKAEGPGRAMVPPSPPPNEGLRTVPGGRVEAPKAWTGAASSVPKLSVVPTAQRPASLAAADEGEAPRDVGSHETESHVDPAADSPSRPTEPAFRPLHEPWYLVWLEALLTNRQLQVFGVVVLAAVVGFFLWPRQGVQGASLGSILRHPERYEGRPIVVRGEVIETFDVGQGHAFQLRQGRDMVVVFSTLRDPRPHDRVQVTGTVSTGYLDGAPRVAIFEGAAAP